MPLNACLEEFGRSLEIQRGVREVEKSDYFPLIGGTILGKKTIRIQFSCSWCNYQQQSVLPSLPMPFLLPASLSFSLSSITNPEEPLKPHRLVNTANPVSRLTLGR